MRTMSNPWILNARAALALLSLVVTLGCPPEPADSCAFAKDGACDEPGNCPLGTDSSDCESACEAGENLHLIAGACAHRAPVDDGDREGVGSGGTLHLVGVRDGTIVAPSGVNGAEVHRHYRLHVPGAYDPARPTPLVVVMPGHRVAIYSLADYTEIERTAETNRFLVVYAEQEFRWDSLRWAWWTDWDWNRLDPHPDLVFLERLVERIAGEYNVDRTRVFAAGHSRGASMALIAALELPDIFAGAASESGFTELGYDERVRAYEGRHVPLYFVHGAADDDVCIDCTAGGRCGVAPTRTCGSVEGSDSLVEILRGKGWSDDDLVYRRLDNVAHRWQPQLNQEMWDFLVERPLPAEELR